MWAALITSSRSVVEMTVVPLLAAWLNCPIVYETRPQLQLAICVSKHPVAQQTPGEGRRQLYSVCFRKSLVSLGSLFADSSGETLHQHLISRTKDGWPHLQNSPDPWIHCLVSKHFTVQKEIGSRKQTVKLKSGSIIFYKIRLTVITVKAEITGNITFLWLATYLIYEQVSLKARKVSGR